MPDRSLRGDLLDQVVADVGVQETDGAGGLVDAREIACVEQTGQVEVLPEFGRGDPQQFVADGPSPQEIGGAPLHLGRARSAQREAAAPVLHEPVNLVQEGGNLLDFIDDDLSVPVVPFRFDLLAQEFRVRQVTSELVALQQVDPAAVRIALAQEGALAGLAWPPEEERLRAGVRQNQ